MRPPAWAETLVAQVCADAMVAPPRLTWRLRATEHSTGVARRAAGVISVRAGRDPLDGRLTLLHEMAHWITPATGHRRGGRAAHHGREFYRTAFELYRGHGLADADALRLEAARYPSALGHAVALGIPGAVAARSAHRETLRARPRRRWRVLVPEHPIRLGRDGRWHVCTTCRQRIVGRHLVRIWRARRALRHVLMVAEPV
ncbi:MAG TPA: hypothetical protein VFP30_00395 [Candidatus Limnocylindria bacterium]|nr:hypothetical protein [Candidatus Limnocylindria bacterium]